MGEIEGIDRLLKEHPFFADMDPKVAETVAGCAVNERFMPGEYIFQEGAKANRFWLLRHGSVAVEVRAPGLDPIIVDTVQTGEILGWSWLVPPFQWITDARANELVRAVGIDAGCLRAKYELDHTLAYELFKRFIPVIARRMAGARLRLTDMYR